MLREVSHYHEPFAYFLCAEAFNDADRKALERLFVGEHNWQHREGEFYRCFLRDATLEVSADLRQKLADRMRDITGLALSERVHVTAQRMEKGQDIGGHSDQPLLGYEIARLVVPLTAPWMPHYGGVLELLDVPDGPAAVSIEPKYNRAFGFVLHPGSLHRVTVVTRTRWSVVFNFWHPANSPELAAAIEAILYRPQFSELPKSLNALACEAENKLSEEVTYGASLSAWLLYRWGYEPSTIIAGYALYAGFDVETKLGIEEYAAIQLARWVTRLAQGHFDPAEWEALKDTMNGKPRFARLKSIWDLCIPEL
jgi:hypothetical protein